jgi:hypothetical protein
MNIDEQFLRLEKQGIPKYFIQCVNKLAYGVGFVGSFNWEKTITGYIKTYWDFFGKDLDGQKKGKIVCEKVFYYFTVSNNQRKSILPSVSDLLERRYIIQKDMQSKEYWEQITTPVKRTEKQSNNLKKFFKEYNRQRFKDGFNYKQFLKDNDFLIKKGD